MDCQYCGMQYMEWRMDEVVSKSRLWDTNMNFWHDCKESPQAKKKKLDAEWKKKRDEVIRAERIRKINKLKSFVFCFQCNKGIKTATPCKHMIADGFEVGRDGGDFYSDSFKAVERRKYLKKQMKKSKNIKPKKSGLDGFV